MAAPAPIPTFVKADTVDKSKLGDCPFCHRVLLTLQNKGIPFKMELIDFDHKPEWLQEASGGKVPVIRDLDGKLMPDSDKITAYLEDKFPQPPMTSSAPAELGSKLLPALSAILFAAKGSPEEAQKVADLVAELRTLDTFLRSHGGPLLGGKQMDAKDVSVAPKLYHTLVAMKHFKGWELPSDLSAVAQYMAHIRSLPTWQAVEYPESSIISAWEVKIKKGALH